jgi:hypothetical protein
VLTLRARPPRSNEAAGTSGGGEEGAAGAASSAYLQQKLVYDGDRLIDADGEWMGD